MTKPVGKGSFMSALLQGGQGSGVFALTGPAGSGKSFAAAELSQKHDVSVYSADFRFIGDSVERKTLLNRKQSRSAVDYQDSANQYNWWDWSAIRADLDRLANGQSVVLDAPYDRASGRRLSPVEIRPARIIMFEGAILGPPDLVERLAKIVFLCTAQRVRFDRIVAKDLKRRSFNELLARFLITEYSETIYYRNLVAWARDRLVFVDTETGHPCAAPSLPDDLFVPLRINPNG